MNRKISVAIILSCLAFPALVIAQEAVPKPETKAHPVDSAAEATGDAWITTKVKSDLFATKGVSGTDVMVDTKGGVVTLTGNVATQAEADKATELASGIKGVTRVNSRLTIRAASP